MSAGFGRLVLDGRIADDPYVEGLDDVGSFEVISDDGPRYRIERHAPEDPAWDGPTWTATRVDPAPAAEVGSLLRRGLWRAQYQFEFRREGTRFAGGADPLLINAVFGLIGELERHRGR